MKPCSILTTRTVGKSALAQAWSSSTKAWRRGTPRRPSRRTPMPSSSAKRVSWRGSASRARKSRKCAAEAIGEGVGTEAAKETRRKETGVLRRAVGERYDPIDRKIGGTTHRLRIVLRGIERGREAQPRRAGNRRGERARIVNRADEKRGQRRNQAAPHHEREDRHLGMALHQDIADRPAEGAGEREAERDRREIAAYRQPDRRQPGEGDRHADARAVPEADAVGSDQQVGAGRRDIDPTLLDRRAMRRFRDKEAGSGAEEPRQHASYAAWQGRHHEHGCRKISRQISQYLPPRLRPAPRRPHNVDVVHCHAY